MTRHLPWIATAIIGVVALAVVALSPGETVTALWIVVASVRCFLVAYRCAALFSAAPCSLRSACPAPPGLSNIPSPTPASARA